MKFNMYIQICLVYIYIIHYICIIHIYIYIYYTYTYIYIYIVYIINEPHQTFKIGSFSKITQRPHKITVMENLI